MSNNAVTGQGITNEKLAEILAQLGIVISSDGVETIDIVHKEIHEGEHYTINFSATKDAGETLDILLVTPDQDIVMHAIGAIFGNNAAGVFLYEDTITSNNGTPLAVRNNNRNSSNISILNAYHTPTISNVGTELQGGLIGGSSPSLKIGGSEAQRFEWILKKNTKYLYRFTATNNSTLGIWNIFFYEKDL